MQFRHIAAVLSVAGIVFGAAACSSTPDKTPTTPESVELEQALSPSPSLVGTEGSLKCAPGLETIELFGDGLTKTVGDGSVTTRTIRPREPFNIYTLEMTFSSPIPAVKAVYASTSMAEIIGGHGYFFKKEYVAQWPPNSSATTFTAPWTWGTRMEGPAMIVLCADT